MKNRIFSKLIFFLFIMLSFSLKSAENNLKHKNIFIFVHGTTNLRYLKKKFFSLRFIYNFILKKIDKNYYDLTIKNRWENIKLNEFNYIIGFNEGLQKIEEKDFDEFKNLPEGAFLTLEWFKKIYYQEILKEDYDFYVFNWDGLIYDISRIDASKKLYDSIINLKKEYLKKGINLKINIISYSHGGNVASLFGKKAEENNFNEIDFIESLIFLGTPVTDYLKSAILLKNKDEYFFKKVFNIYSEKDIIKSLGEFLHSRKTYKNIKDIDREGFFQIRFKYAKRKNKKHDPSHAEFVYYTTIKNKNLPVFILIPIFLSKDFKDKANKKRLIEAVLFQESNKIIFYEQKTKKIIYEKNTSLFYDEYLAKANDLLKKNNL